jgi:hypothetical protein
VVLGSLDVDKWNTMKTEPTIARLLDHFLVLHIPAPSESDVRSTFVPALKVRVRFFGLVLCEFPRSFPQNFLLAFDSPELLQMGTALVEGSVAVTRSLASTLLPSTPLRAHYHFGYWNLVRVFQGILSYNPSSKSETLPKLILVKYAAPILHHCIDELFIVF